jgi:hypothetical protein
MQNVVALPLLLLCCCWWWWLLLLLGMAQECLCSARFGSLMLLVQQKAVVEVNAEPHVAIVSPETASGFVRWWDLVFVQWNRMASV